MACVERLLKGPVEQETNTKFVINLRTVKAIGVTVPISLLGRADEVVE